MNETKILDAIIKDETQLEVRALSTDSRRPLHLDGILINYDSEGYLVRGKERGKQTEKENAFYVAKGALAYFKFSSESIPSIKNSAEPDEVSELEESFVFRPWYVISNTMYDAVNHTIRKGDKKQRIHGEKKNYDIALLFKTGLNKIVSSREFERLSEDEKLTSAHKANLKVRISETRCILNEFGLDIVAVRGQGYALREYVKPL